MQFNLSRLVATKRLVIYGVNWMTGFSPSSVFCQVLPFLLVTAACVQKLNLKIISYGNLVFVKSKKKKKKL